jgi:hypothetical protein
LEIHYGPLLYALLLHTAAPYGSLPQFQTLKTLKICSTKLEQLFVSSIWSFPRSHHLSLSIFLPITITFDFLELNFRFHLLANLAVILRINRISFGASLWTSIIRPSFAHGCAVWFPSAISNAQNIENLQYQAGTINYRVRTKFVSYNLVFSGHFHLWMFLYDK